MTLDVFHRLIGEDHDGIDRDLAFHRVRVEQRLAKDLVFIQKQWAQGEAAAHKKPERAMASW